MKLEADLISYVLRQKHSKFKEKAMTSPWVAEDKVQILCFPFTMKVFINLWKFNSLDVAKNFQPASRNIHKQEDPSLLRLIKKL